MRSIFRWKVWTLETHICRKPWMKAGCDGLVHVSTATGVARAEELVCSNSGCQLQGTSNIKGYLPHFGSVRMPPSYTFYLLQPYW